MIRNNPSFRRMKRAVGISLVSLGIVTFIINAVLSFFGKLIPVDIEMPLSDIGGIAVSQEHVISVAMQDYGRIQQYDIAGRFIRAVSFDTGWGRPFIIDPHKQDNVIVATMFRRKRIIFDRNLRMISSVPDHHLYDELKKQGNASIHSGDKEYFINRSLLGFSSIEMRDSEGVATVIKKVPSYMWPIAHKFLTWSLIPLGVYLCAPLGSKPRE